jgi:hypothetical protein
MRKAPFETISEQAKGGRDGGLLRLQMSNKEVVGLGCALQVTATLTSVLISAVIANSYDPSSCVVPR